MQPIEIDATMEGCTPLKDGGMSWRFHTQEVSAKGKAAAMEYFQQFGKLVFGPADMDTSKLDLGAGEKERKGKSPSLRLRNTLYRVWEQKGQPGGNFEVWYEQRIEQYINHEKEKLV